MRFHSFLASSSNHDGHRGAFLVGLGSLWLRGRLPGLPSRTFKPVGFGLRPRCDRLLSSYLLFF